ncbi:J domain-containing protein CG6693-like [Drosophila tropicalis]|uniref:J domain-containing protein CG6693-like n=1 Tax=Drosophila tropicalis TaxID=46794 RepID=UPI0035ABB432
MSMYRDSLRLFNVENVYDVLDIPPESLPRQIREAAYQLILHEHPDLKPLTERIEAFEKCRLVHKILLILTDAKKRAVYDKRGSLGLTGSSNQMTLDLTNLLDQCFALMKFPLDGASVRENFLHNYKGSLLEKRDIKTAYILGKGSMDRILTEVPLTTVKDENRIKKIIRSLIRTKELKTYKKFENDAADKRRSRKKRFAAFTVEEEQNKAMDELLVKYNKDLDVGALDYNDDDELAANTPAQPSDILLTRCNGDLNAVLNNLSSKYGSDTSCTQMETDPDYEQQ